MKKIKFTGILMAMVMLMCTGCGKTTEDNTVTTSQEENVTKNDLSYEDKDVTGTYDIDKDELPFDEDVLYQQLFDINNTVVFDIDISDEELDKMASDYKKYDERGSKSPIYRKCDVTISISGEKSNCTYVIKNVGVRMKGNTSRTDFYSSDKGIYALTHLRLSFDCCFDEEEHYKENEYDLGFDPDKQKKRTFASLSGLEVKWNQTDDSTYVREYYTLEMYRYFDVASQRINIAKMKFAGINEGVFKIYEPVDKKFLKRNFGEEELGGDLYKCGWTRNGASFTKEVSYGIEDEDRREFYNYDLKTNKNTSQHESLTALISYFNGKDVTKEGISEYLDMDYFLKYSAVSYFVGDPDDLRNNYNNYYIYFLKSSGKMVIIPYDKDRTFGITKHYNPTGTGMTDVKYESERAVGKGSQQENPLINYTITRSGLFQDEFRIQIDAVLNSKWMTTDYFNSLYEIAKAHYENDTKPECEMKNAKDHDFKFDNEQSAGLNSGDKNASFSDYIEAKLKFFNEEYNK